MNQDPPAKPKIDKTRLMVIIAILVMVGGVTIEWLVGHEIIPVETYIPGMILGISIFAGTILVCCTATLHTGTLAQRIPEYSEMEMVFEEGMDYFEAGEWERALSVFKKLMGEEMNHKRALYYSARASEELERWDDVKKFCNLYIKMQPKDREVWELLAKAHKKLFEYEQAEDAMKKAENLR